MNADLLLQLAIDAVAAANSYFAQLQAAKAAGVDITDAQLDQAKADYLALHSKLDADIAAARGG